MSKSELLTQVSPEAVEITENLQLHCAKAFLSITRQIQAGMSEAEIAKIYMDELSQRGVRDYWYDIPILVLIGPERFMDMDKKDYKDKEPSEKVKLESNATLFVDMHPRDSVSGRWGNLARTIIFKPKDLEQHDLLGKMVEIHQNAIKNIRPETAVQELVDGFDRSFKENGTTLLDVRQSYGHNMGEGTKNSFDRVFWEHGCPYLLNGQIWGIEPSGIKHGKRGQLLVARVEDCVHVSEKGVRLLGGEDAARSQEVFSVK